MFKSQIAFSTLFGLSALLVSSLEAYALRDGDDARTLLRLENSAKNTVFLEGKLGCQVGANRAVAAADGATCTVALTESNSGKVFKLKNAGQALSMIQAGKTSVKIEGKLADESTLNVAGITEN